jgi:hypothetical protein
MVEASTMDPLADGRLYADMSIVRDLDVAEIAGPGVFPDAHLPFRSIRVLIVGP